VLIIIPTSILVNKYGDGSIINKNAINLKDVGTVSQTVPTFRNMARVVLFVDYSMIFE